MNPLFISPLIELGKSIIGQVWPDKAQQAEAERRLLELQQTGQLRGIELQLSAIIAEAQSSDKWTSRARPSFLYVMYTVILLCVFGAIVGIWWPDQVAQAGTNLSALLGGLPELLWWLFGTGYLGYTGARTFEKRKKGT